MNIEYRSETLQDVRNCVATQQIRHDYLSTNRKGEYINMEEIRARTISAGVEQGCFMAKKQFYNNDTSGCEEPVI